MSWLLLSQDLPPGFVGGIASWVDDVALALACSGEEVTLIARRTGDTGAWDRGRPYRVIRARGRSWGRWQGLWTALPALFCLQPGTRILCATWPLATGVLPLAEARGLPVLVAAHGSELTMLPEAPAALRRLSGRVRFLPVSSFLLQELERLGIPVEDAQVLPMPLSPVPVPVPAPARSRRRGLVCLARLTPLKGIDRAIRLARALDEPLTIIGDGPERAALEALGGPVRFLGRLPRPAALEQLAGARAALLLPRTDSQGRGAEGLGLCLLEAAALGVAAIGCRTGGVPEATGPGLLLDDPDQPDLAAVRALLDDPLAGERARAWVEARHGPQRCLERLRSALASVGP